MKRDTTKTEGGRGLWFYKKLNPGLMLGVSTRTRYFLVIQPPAVLHKQKQQATAVRRGGWIDVEEWSGAAKPTPDRQDPAHSIVFDDCRHCIKSPGYVILHSVNQDCLALEASCLRLQPKPGFRSLQLEVRFPLRVSQWSPRRALSHSSFAAFCFCFSTRRAWLPFKAQLIHLLRSQLENKQSDGAYALAARANNRTSPAENGLRYLKVSIHLQTLYATISTTIMLLARQPNL